MGRSISIDEKIETQKEQVSKAKDMFFASPFCSFCKCLFIQM